MLKSERIRMIDTPAAASNRDKLEQRANKSETAVLPKPGDAPG
jgi:hypothetical protein